MLLQLAHVLTKERPGDGALAAPLALAASGFEFGPVRTRISNSKGEQRAAGASSPAHVRIAASLSNSQNRDPCCRAGPSCVYDLYLGACGV